MNPMRDVAETVSYNSEEIRRENIREVLKHVEKALSERGYNAINQLAGYLISNDPAYISSHNNARSIIQSVERHEIIEELVRYYLEEKIREGQAPPLLVLFSCGSDLPSSTADAAPFPRGGRQK